jgi:ADP-ribose pyrophosphatase YjhB (NUDIX family)
LLTFLLKFELVKESLVKSFTMSVEGFDHHIQREIFLKLRQHDVARYADINIKTIESSQFMYHLKELIRAGLVEKVEKGRYRLTRKGIALSQGFSTERKNIALAPLSYTLIFARSKNGKYLVVRRNKQPFIDMYACISGKIHMDETLKEAAAREWDEDIPLKLPKLSYKGYVSVLVKETGQTLAHITGPVWFADKLEEEWESVDTRIGHVQWVDWEELPYDQFIPGWKEIVSTAESEQEPFLLDLSFTL